MINFSERGDFIRHRKLYFSFCISIFIFNIFNNPATPLIAQSRPVIKIGALGPLTAPNGMEMVNGAVLAVNEINNGAGIDVGGTAHDFELITETSSGPDGIPDPVVAQTNLEKLVQTDQVVAVIGGFRIEVALGAIMPYINNTHTPFLGIDSKSPIITEYFYRVGELNQTTITRNLLGSVGYLQSQKEISTIAIIREDQAYAMSFYEALVYYLPVFWGIEVNTQIPPIPVTADFNDIESQLQNLATNTSVDAVISIFHEPVGKVLTEAWKSLLMNQNKYLFGLNLEAGRLTSYNDTEGAVAGELLLEEYTHNYFPTPQTADYVTKYISVYGKIPSRIALTSYDAIYILKDAIERANDFSSASMHSFLPSTEYLGVWTKYRFTSEISVGQVAGSWIPAALKIYDDAIVHDLYTTSTVGITGYPYPQMIMTQWDNSGNKNIVWDIGGSSSAPILDPPYDGVYTSPTGNDTTSQGNPSGSSGQPSESEDSISSSDSKSTIDPSNSPTISVPIIEFNQTFAIIVFLVIIRFGNRKFHTKKN